MRILVERFWTYAVEVVAAGSICVLLWLAVGPDRIAAWQVQKRADLLAFTAVAAAFSAAIFAACIAILSTDFGKKLRLRKMAAEYASAFAFPLVLLTATAATIEFLDKRSGTFLSETVTFLLSYSCLNCISMVRNILGIVRLWEEVG